MLNLDESTAYPVFIERLRAMVMQKKQTLLEFGFRLMDADQNGFICPRDLSFFQTRFGAMSLMADYY